MPDFLLPLLLGWLLGLLSPIIYDANKTMRKRRDVKKGLLLELQDLRYRLACTVYPLSKLRGEYNRQALERVLDVLKECSGDEVAKRLSRNIQSLLEASDEQIKALGQASAPSDGSFFSLKKYALPFLDTQLDQLYLYSVESQRKLLEIRAQVRILHEQIDEIRQFFYLTYDTSISDQGRERLGINLRNLYGSVYERSLLIINAIETLNL